MIAILVSRHYYRRSSEDLKQEAENLRRLNILTIQILDHADLLPPNVRLAKDEHGNYTGAVALEARGVSTPRSSARATPTAAQGMSTPRASASATPTGTPGPTAEETPESGTGRSRRSWWRKFFGM